MHSDWFNKNPMVYCASKLFYKAIDHTFYAFTSITTHLGCWENT